MAGWKDLGAVVSDPWPDDADTAIWTSLLQSAVFHDHKLYVKLIGLRFAGAELQRDERFGYRLAMANKAAVTQQEVRELLAPHAQLLINLFLHLSLGGGADGQQKTDT